MTHRFRAAAPKPGHTDIDPDSIRTWTNARTGRPEIRTCTSTDGQWCYTRVEDRGTTWDVLHVPTGRVLSYEPSLPLARSGTASGWILAELDRRQPLAAAAVTSC